jgi:SOS regulatory protein LexA
VLIFCWRRGAALGDPDFGLAQVINDMEISYRQICILEFVLGYLSKYGACPDVPATLEGLDQESLWSLRIKLDQLARNGWINPLRGTTDPIIPTPRVFQELWQLNFKQPSTAISSPEVGDSGDPKEAPDSFARFHSLPLAGRITAGKPIETFQQSGFISLADIVDSKEIYVLEVNGNSMIDDHIMDGDYVAIEKCSLVSDGEIAVALLHGYETTLKRLYREEGNIIRLQPANPAMDPIFVDAKDVAVQGKVVAVLRRF